MSTILCTTDTAVVAVVGLALGPERQLVTPRGVDYIIGERSY